MAISLKHLFTSLKADGPDSTLVQPSDWNAEHVLQMATARLVGRTTAGTGAAEEISVGANFALTAGSLDLASTVSIAALTASGAVNFTGTGAAKLPVGTTAERPTPATGQVRYNSDLGQFEGYGASTWGSLGGGATGGGSDRIFMLNGQTVTTSYTIPSGQNALTAGPITINSGVTVTIPSGSVWTIV